VIAKRKGVVARRGLKEAWSKGARRWTRIGYKAYSAGRAGSVQRSPQPSRALAVDSGGCASKAVVLITGGLAHVPESGLRVEQSTLTVRQESAAGVVVAQAAKAQTAGSGE
jgi:hypothetical protein